MTNIEIGAERDRPSRSAAILRDKIALAKALYGERPVVVSLGLGDAEDILVELERARIRREATPDPNDPDQHRTLLQAIESPVTSAQMAAEALRWVMHRIGRLRVAGDVYSLVGAQVTVLERLPQALDAMSDWLQRHQGELRMGPSDVPPMDEHVRDIRVTLEQARLEIEAALYPLRRTQALLSPLYGPEGAARAPSPPTPQTPGSATAARPNG